MIAFRVFGLPVAQGSTRAFVVKGRPVITSTAKGLGAWRNQIAAAAQDANTEALLRDGTLKGDDGGGYEVICVFFLPRPRSLPKRYRHPTKRPDTDKLVRAVFDALTGIMWHDDAQVIKIMATKAFASEDEPPGVAIAIRCLNTEVGDA